jgi:hypothetical protein
MTSRGEQEVCPKRKAMRGNKVLLVKTRQYTAPLRFSHSSGRERESVITRSVTMDIPNKCQPSQL